MCTGSIAVVVGEKSNMVHTYVAKNIATALYCVGFSVTWDYSHSSDVDACHIVDD